MPNWVWTFRDRKRADALNDIKSRLEAEVGRCLPILAAADTGHFAMVRMLMPIIEATSEGKPWGLLRDLGVLYPSVFWQVYRNTLMHKDELRIVLYRSWRVGWELDYVSVRPTAFLTRASCSRTRPCRAHGTSRPGNVGEASRAVEGQRAERGRVRD
jgi:hypothetical protein